MTPGSGRKLNLGRFLVFGSILCFFVMCSCGSGYLWGWYQQEGLQSRTIAFSLGDASWGDFKAFYGARVFYEEAEKPGEVVVKLEVEIGSGNGYFHGPVVIGRASTVQEARVKWRKIEWTKEALLVGEGRDRYVLSRASLESHR